MDRKSMMITDSAKRKLEIYRRISNGEKTKDLAKEYSVSCNRIRQLAHQGERFSRITYDDPFFDGLCGSDIRPYNALMRRNIKTIDDAIAHFLVHKTFNDIRNIGEISNNLLCKNIATFIEQRRQA